MIEVVYKTEQKKAEGNEGIFRIPNNIRQIGEWKGHEKIYIEDYAYTFLRKISREPEQTGQAAILLGSHHWAEDCSYLFIKSALRIQEMEVSPEHLVFSDKVWGQIYEDTKKYFPGQEIVGWFASLPGFNMQINEVLLKTHLNHFAGNDKVLFLVEPGEWEEAFFIYENNQLVRQTGYYIYYEKNDPMQAYMIEMSNNKSIEETEKVPDRAVSDFRKMVKEKNEKNGKTKLLKGQHEQIEGTREEKQENPEEEKQREEKQEKENPVKSGKDTSVRWLAGACVAAAVFAVGINYFNGHKELYRKDSAEETIIEMGPTEEVEEVSSDFVPTIIIQENQKNEGEKITQEKNSHENTIPMEKNETTEVEGMVVDEEVISQTEDQPTLGNGIRQVEEYVIQMGDTMTSICRNKYGSIERLKEICDLNGITPEDTIYAGKKLLLPD